MHARMYFIQQMIILWSKYIYGIQIFQTCVQQSSNHRRDIMISTKEQIVFNYVLQNMYSYGTEQG